ncbi:MAG: bifunctional diaminohydroxyphosphoribosylaminopyrimidine deaminase/5-amino-6-(5-phosphoribosylamino)uracil reductase RibD [Pseudomonadota bacterium]
MSTPATAIEPNHYAWMSKAIQLANRGRYTTRPNPNVGCVIVKDSVLVAEGWHYRAGEAHAEVHALNRAGQQAQGADAYVTLEPCSHHGKTGPCCEALIEAGIARVIYGMQDPNPLVAGRGLSRMREQGIEVIGPVMEAESQALNQGFICRMRNGRPWVRAKLAMSLDGRTAMADGTSQWITAAAARADVQKWRARSGAIITGIGSILADNSRLSLRPQALLLDNRDDIIQRPPLRVVLDSRLRISLDAAILEPDAPTLIITSDVAYEQQLVHANALTAPEHISLLALPLSAGTLPLAQVLKYLADEHQCNDVLIEAGATLSGAFWQQGLIDELIIYQAPVLMGSEGRPLITLPIHSMAQKQPLTIIDQRQIGQDWRIIAHPTQ